MVKSEFPTHQPLSHMQKDLRLALGMTFFDIYVLKFCIKLIPIHSRSLSFVGMSESLDHPLPIIATINEIYKQAKRAGYSEHDSSAIYLKSKF